LVIDEMEVGGTQRQIVEIARGLDRARFHLSVGYFRNRSFLVDELSAAGVPTIEIPKSRRIDFSFVRRFAAVIRNGRFDVMHCFAFSAELWGAIARRFVRASERPTLITSVRGVYEHYSRVHWRLQRWVASQATLIIANSRAGAEFARKNMRLGSGAIALVYNGVADLSNVATSGSDSPSGSATALFAGRLIESKNLPVLLRAMQRLHNSGSRIRLRIAGDGPWRDVVRHQVITLGIDSAVELLGERTDVPGLIATSDFVVLPSFHEGLSNVILEAMAVGRPVIASAVGGSIELVDRETGLLFPCDDDAALAEAMQTLTADPALRKRLGAEGHRRATERFGLESMLHTMEQHYAFCAAQRAAPQ
jgi:glycosyltransferase involved in cell wall biosynthesis